jgi:hypothetical protein
MDCGLGGEENLGVEGAGPVKRKRPVNLHGSGSYDRRGGPISRNQSSELPLWETSLGIWTRRSVLLQSEITSKIYIGKSDLG